jgi:CheY-like chemotaxis protein
MDSIEAAERIRASFNIPVVYLTAHADERTLERAKVTEPFGATYSNLLMTENCTATATWAFTGTTV